MLVHLLEELSHTWSHQYKYIADIALDLNWQNYIRILDGLE